MDSSDLLKPMRGTDWSALLIRTFPELSDMQDITDTVHEESDTSKVASTSIIALIIFAILSAVIVIGGCLSVVINALMTR